MGGRLAPPCACEGALTLRGRLSLGVTMLIPAFKINLGHPINHGQVVVGCYDEHGKLPSLTCATSAGKVFLHCPHSREEDYENDIRFLNINRKITALGAGRLDPTLARDVLLVGTQTNLLAYDVEQNSDIFYVDVPDGVNRMLFGKIGDSVDMAIVGGNCSIQGFGHGGSELFWTVTGDNVTAMAFCDVDEDGKNELLVGSEDYEIRIFQNEEVVSENTETDKVVGLCPLRGTVYGYALGNGTIGVYDKTSRVWRVKSKNTVTSIAGFDLDGDGVPELISGWSNGKVEVRNDHNGEVVYKDYFNAPISGIVESDYRLDGRVEIIVAAGDGEVRGYLPTDVSEGATPESLNSLDEVARGLEEKKQALLTELRNYEAGLKVKKKKKKDGQTDPHLIPSDTKIIGRLEPNQAANCVDLVLTTSTDTVIQLVAIFSDQVFEGESHVVAPQIPEKSIRVPIAPPRDVSAVLHIKALVGNRGGSIFHVFELEQTLSKFSMYVPQDLQQLAQPSSSVTFQINERNQRIAMWIQSAFAVPESAIQLNVGVAGALSAGFSCLRDGKPLIINLTPAADGSASMITVSTDSIEAAGEVVQELASYLQMTALQSKASFPSEVAAFRDVLEQVELYNQTRLTLAAEVADSSNLIKALVIKAEDARILGEMQLMREIYSNLFDLNRDLLLEHTKRTTNHNKLLAALRTVNHMIQKAARLRVGSYKQQLVSSARTAIKNNNIGSVLETLYG